MARWPSGVPVFRWLKYVVVGTGFEGCFIEGLKGVKNLPLNICWMYPRDVCPLNDDARAMLAIAKAGGR